MEVHLSEEDGNKDGGNDKRCMLEERLVGMKPIAVTNNSNTQEKAILSAIDKLIISVEKISGRLKEY